MAEIRQAMALYRPEVVEDGGKRHAAVAAIFHEDATGVRLLFIERARCEGDPWSGHIAFPGGGMEAQDAGARAAAERETLEEIGLDLRTADYLGRLDDVAGATLPVRVSGFVYGVDEMPERFAMNHEVREVFWTRVDDLLDPERRVTLQVRFEGEEPVRPGIDLLGPGRPVLWGITYRFVTRFLEILGWEITVK